MVADARTMLRNEYEPAEVSHPGETLQDLLEERAMTQAELARRTGRPKKTVNEIVKGKQAITPETAIQLERVFGVPASFWNSRQRIYDQSVASRANDLLLSQWAPWLKKFPIKEMRKRGYISDTPAAVEIVKELLSFFGVASPEALEAQRHQLRVIYRKSAAFEANEYALMAWLRQGQREAARMPLKTYERGKFRAALNTIRALTREPTATFVPRLQDVCAACGVAVVFIPELPKIRAFGAIYWQAGNPVIQLCLRGKRDDQLWFTFFHEAGHLCLHEGRRAVYLEIARKVGAEDEAADRFASELLISRKDLDEFARRCAPLTDERIEQFAEEQGIAAGIVVGQLQHFGYVPHSHFNRLRKTLRWAGQDQ